MIRILCCHRSREVSSMKFTSLFSRGPPPGPCPLQLRRGRPSFIHARDYGSNSCGETLKIGVLRETYDKWERRAPLCPEHVQMFLGRHPGSEVIVQPSPNRIFSCQDYERAGAKIQEDLSHVDLILGVKRPRSMENLPSEKTYMFFSHVIKGQSHNMPLLQSCLEKRVQLIDYECIVDSASDSSKSKRSIAFGKFAGYAGMVDTFPVLGRRLLMKNSWSTPFLHCPPTIHHYDLVEVKQSITKLAEHITTDGLPVDMPPLVFAMTGKGGCVYGGVREIFDILPHETVSVEELPEIMHQKGPQFQVYVVAPEKHEIYQNEINGDSAFDRSDYMTNPHLYKSVFAHKVAPYVSVIINAAYWDYRFPRILTKDEMKRLYAKGNDRLVVVNDISCDPGGSIEFFERSTTIDRPSYQYDPIQGREVTDHIDNIGVTLLGVDILPTELPADSSRHFGNKLSHILEDFVLVKATSQERTLNISKFPQKLKQATITTIDGLLNPPFQYLDSLMKPPFVDGRSRDTSKFMVLHLEGHLFDSGLINHVLDLIERHECCFEFERCFVPRRSVESCPVRSQAILKVTGEACVDLIALAKKVRDLVDAIHSADATLRVIDKNNTIVCVEDPEDRTVLVEDPEDRTVLVLGSGMVSKSVVELLGRSNDRMIIVASDNEAQARRSAQAARRGQHACLDVVNDRQRLADLVKQCDLVVSMLPAPMHPEVAELCIKYQKDMVTASYESEMMRKFREAAEDTGIIILNEVGLDPGLDHMSAMRLIDDIRARGGFVTGFRSVCGGLPAPEAADNPLKYKFSWNPKGVISASHNSARYRENNINIEVDGDCLLENAAPYNDAWCDLHLECLPNRDSLIYEKVYGIDGADSIFRGTLRYAGFSSLLQVFRKMGFFGLQHFEAASTWEDIIQELQRIRGHEGALQDFVRICAGEDQELAQRAMVCLKWLRLTGRSDEVDHSNAVVDLFCARLEKHLRYGKGETDMVVMHHAISASFEDGSVENHTSTLQTFGDESMTAMCRTVGYPTAAASDLILRGSLSGKHGLLLPTTKDIYLPVLDKLAKEGIVFKDRVRVAQAQNSNLAKA